MAMPLALFDIREVPQMVGPLHTFGIATAFALLPLMIAFEAVRNNVAALEGKAEHSSIIMKSVLAVAGILGYKLIFTTMMWSVYVVQNSLVGIDTYMKFVISMHEYQATQTVSLFKSQLPILFAWFGVFLGVLGDQILSFIQFAILSLLYFIGPISMVLYIYKPTSYLLTSWIKNVYAVACWTLVLHVIVLALIQFNKSMFMDQGILDPVNTMRTLTASITFVVMVVLSPYFAEKLIAGQAMGSLAVMAASYMMTMSTKAATGLGLSLPMGTGGGLGRLGGGMLSGSKTPVMASGNMSRGTESSSKNDQWRQRENGRGAGENTNNAQPRPPRRFARRWNGKRPSGNPESSAS